MKNYLRIKMIVFLFGILSFSTNWAQDHSLNFDGIKDYVQWGDPEQGSPGPYAVTPIVDPLVGSDFSIELWMKSDISEWTGSNNVLFAFNSYNPITNGSNRLILALNASGRLYLHDGDNTGLSTERWRGTTVVADGKCRHIAFTHNFTTKETIVYVDGVSESGSLFTTFVLSNTDIFSLGQEWDNLDYLHDIEPHLPSQFYYGEMDDIRLWTSSRFASQISENMNTTFSPTEPDLLAYFKVDQGVAADDNTSELFLENTTLPPGLDGDLEGFTKLTEVSNFVYDPCAPCYAQSDESFIRIFDDIEYTSDMFWDNKYYIDDTVIVTVSDGAILDITNVDVVFGECAGIVVKEGASVRINNSVLRPCSVYGTWIGITFEGLSSIEDPSNVINESTFKNAAIALSFKRNTDALISNNLFSNCNYGIRVVNSLDFKHAISGNRFVTESYYPTYGECYEIVDNLSSFGIWTSSAKFSQHISHNEFINSNGSSLPYVTGISQLWGESTASNNTFTDMLHAFVVEDAKGYTSIVNNRIEINFPSSTFIPLSNISIFIDATNLPLVEVNNNQLINNENQILAYAAIGLKNSSNISIATNEIEGFERGITAVDAYNCQITENHITNSTSMGIYFKQLIDAIPTSSYITCNTIKMKSYVGSFGIYIEDMESVGEISSNCILDCFTSLYLEGFGRLPKIRNNYLYNYTNFGIDVRNYIGNIGVPSTDPGMNTLWSNDNSAFDINCFPNNIDVADNFGMFYLSLSYITVTSAYPYHSTASCGHQIVDRPQGNLNPEYICDHKRNIIIGLEGTETGYQLAPDYLEELNSATNPYNFINTIIGSVENLSEINLDNMLNGAELDQNEEALLKYSYYLRKSNLEQAKVFMNLFTPATEEMEVFKRLRLISIQFLQEGNSVFNADNVDFLETVISSNQTQTNYATYMLNSVKNYTDYTFDAPTLRASVKPSKLYNLDAEESYLKIYPNPAVSSITIELEISEESDLILVTDITGKIVTTVSVNFIAGVTQVDISNLSQGVYYIVLTNPETGVKQKEKFVKMAE